MQFIKYIMLFLVLLGCSLIGRMLAKKYINRVKELEEMKQALNIFRSKIKFTYEPIPEIFGEMANSMKNNIGAIFGLAKEKMEKENASVAWEEAVEESKGHLLEEDKYVIKSMSKLLGQTDVEGQLSQIGITEKFLDAQINEAQQLREKNERLYNKLGTIMGLAIIIILC